MQLCPLTEDDLFLMPIEKKGVSFPSKPIHIIVDTDAGSEIDDQFALAYLFSYLGENIVIDGIYAAPFREGLPRDPSLCEPVSYEEIKRVLRLAFPLELPNSEIPVFHGSTRYLWQAEDGSDAHKDCLYDLGPWNKEGFLGHPVLSEASAHLVKTARKYSPEDPLWVISIGASTNIASALLMEPTIADNINILFLAGNSSDKDKINEFNAKQDPFAFALLESAPHALRFPCTGCCDELAVSVEGLSETLRKAGGILTEYLAEINDKRFEMRKKKEADPRNTVLWDVAPVAYLFHPEWFDLTDDKRCVKKIRAKEILADVFARYKKRNKEK